ncbi:DUF2000 domain-containing protein [Actinoalloteichus hymeniacidonis]|uniref:DUF2000 family protein n=1 Tax=Actinoalloteichus hymeniacidonis TaxID=340345 RepID=A0AAC9HMN4_9PSEU|nr:DUF2000 domain-containing protein [Actinoalloteichus hymeniacidonis]AOS62035.1 hypothetical protein TL08_06050 [Actinoalloteichus hymeniacidonis]MBB5909943.1 hypothetical protein [Actinoalloteichus hymeniacidonis]
MQNRTKIAVVVRDDLAAWQRLNVTAFLVSGIAARFPETIGEDYLDASDVSYLPMFGQPIVVHAAEAEGLRKAREKAVTRELAVAIYPEELFAMSTDAENRAAVRTMPTEKLALAGLAVYGGRNAVDKALKGLPLHG